MKTITTLIILTLSGAASAQQTTIYGPDGRATTRSTTDTQGTTTIYDARTGNVAGRVSRPPPFLGDNHYRRPSYPRFKERN